MSHRLLVCACLVLAGTLTPAWAEGEPTTTVGLPGQIRDLVLPGSELESRPNTDRKTPIVLRIIRVFPHGTAHRYDLEYVGLEPGSFNLRDYLQRKDRSSTADLPSIQVKIDSVLPPGQVVPNELPIQGTPRPGGYRIALILGGVVWLIGLLLILGAGRRRRKQQTTTAPVQSLADRLRPLIDEALAGRGDPVRLAELERTLISFWTRKLHRQQCKPAETLTELRRHPEAGPLLVQLENWLHRPGSSGKIDTATLLEPYRRLPADVLEVEVRA
jgi:hypothetical protein